MAELLSELDRDIWRPFREAYGALDAEAFLALYSADLIRAGGPTKAVYGYPEYATQTKQWFAGLRERGSTVDIEFRFAERIAAGGLASERGVFRLTAARSTGDQRTFYGRFHTFARKIEGHWRIAVDYDSDENGAVTEATFRAASPHRS